MKKGILMTLSLITLIGTNSYAFDSIFDHKETNIHVKNFLPNGYSPYMTNGNVQKREIDLHLNTDILKYGYWNNTVWSLWDQHGVRWVGWNYQIGARLTKFLDVEYEHFSKHIMDHTNPFKDRGEGRFPVEDAISVKIYLYRAPASNASIF